MPTIDASCLCHTKDDATIEVSLVQGDGDTEVDFFEISPVFGQLSATQPFQQVCRAFGLQNPKAEELVSLLKGIIKDKSYEEVAALLNQES